MCSRSQMFLLSKPDSLESWPCNLDDYTPDVFQERAPSERFKLVIISKQTVGFVNMSGAYIYVNYSIYS